MNHDLTQNSEKTNTSRCLSSDRKLILCPDASKSFDFLSRSSDSLYSDDDTSTCKVSGNAKSFDTKIAKTTDLAQVQLSDRPRFARHMDEHGRFHNEELHQCDTCKGMFLKSSYSDHVTYCAKQTSRAQLCGDDKIFLCKLCDTREINSARHCDKHLANKPYKCSVCFFSSNDEICVRRHCRRPACAPNHATLVSTKDRECGSCREVFRNKKLYIKHYIEMHTIMLKQFDWCNDCGFWLKSIDARYHRKKVHSKTYVCDVCRKAFKTQQQLNNHKVSHAEATKPCEYCGKKFKTANQLHRHVVYVHETSEKNHRCAHCGKYYKSPESLQSHIDMYHGAPVEYACEVCGKCFKTAPGRRVHMLTHTEDRPFKCTKCQKGFKSSMRLKLHMVSHSDERKYKCDLCEWSFKQKNHLIYHMRSHSDDRAFQCTVCERSFKSKPALRDHIFSHTGERPFACSHCQKDFIRKTDLKKHLHEEHNNM